MVFDEEVAQITRFPANPKPTVDVPVGVLLSIPNKFLRRRDRIRYVGPVVEYYDLDFFKVPQLKSVSVEFSVSVSCITLTEKLRDVKKNMGHDTSCDIMTNYVMICVSFYNTTCYKVEWFYNICRISCGEKTC